MKNKITNYNHHNDWFFEGNISKKLVNYLKENEYEILKDNSDNIKAKGADIIAKRKGYNEIIEVKGYPTEYYTNGTKKGLPKKTKPKLQAKHWFSEALYSTIVNYHKYQKKGKINLALAFPLIDTYKDFIEKVSDFFSESGLNIKVYFIDEKGCITIENLNRKSKKS